MGDVTFVQAAGFLKIVAGENPLDATWIHPENYAAAEKLLAKLGIEPAAVVGPDGAAKVRELVAPLDRQALATELGVGKLTLDDMIEALSKPGRDPREDLPPPIFRKDVVKFEDLQPGMELRGTVLNVVDFGAFVDVGLSDSGLVHISQLSATYVRDPHDVVAVGDQVRVWVASIDKDRRRVALTMVRAGHRAAEAGREAAPRAATPAAAASRRARTNVWSGADASSRRKAHRVVERRQAAAARASSATRAARSPRRASAADGRATRSARRRKWCRSPRPWKKARKRCGRLATCYNSIRRKTQAKSEPAERKE